jgi:WD40 repeat protein
MFVGHHAAVTDVTFHPNCELIASLSGDCSARIWDAREGTSVRLFHCQSTKFAAPCFAPNGRLFGFFDGKFKVCDLGSGDVIKSCGLPVGELTAIGFGSGSEDAYLVARKGDVWRVVWDGHDEGATKIAAFNERVVGARFVAPDELVLLTARNVSY